MRFGLLLILLAGVALADAPKPASVAPKEYPIMGGYDEGKPAADPRLDALDFRLSAAEQWGAQAGYKPPTKAADLAGLDKRLRAMENFGARAGYRMTVKLGAVPTVENLEARLTAAEQFGATMGYVPPTVANYKSSENLPHSYSSPKTITCTRMKRGPNGEWVPDVTWTEPAPAWLSNGGACVSGSCAATAKQMPAMIQGGCSSGNCPKR